MERREEGKNLTPGSKTSRRKALVSISFRLCSPLVQMRLQRICKWSVLIFSLCLTWSISLTIFSYWTFTIITSHQKTILAFTDTRLSWLHYLAAHTVFMQASVHQDKACEVHDKIANYRQASRDITSCYYIIHYAWHWKPCTWEAVPSLALIFGWYR
jgi:hypothetical protein